MAKRKIFVVMGTTGEYSDRSEWPVAAVETEDEAKQYIAALERQYQNIPPSMKQDRWKNRDKVKALMTLDPSFDEDYTGTSYFMCEVPFVPSADLFAELAA